MSDAQAIEVEGKIITVLPAPCSSCKPLQLSHGAGAYLGQVAQHCHHRSPAASVQDGEYPYVSTRPVSPTHPRHELRRHGPRAARAATALVVVGPVYRRFRAVRLQAGAYSGSVHQYEHGWRDDTIGRLSRWRRWISVTGSNLPEQSFLDVDYRTTRRRPIAAI